MGLVAAALCAVVPFAGAQTGTPPEPAPSASPVPRRPRRKPIVVAPDPTPAPKPPPRLTVTEKPKTVPPAGSFGAGVLLCTLTAPFVNESSGLAASRRNPGVFWTHNDSGDGAYLYAFDRTGATAGVFLARSAFAGDWEDMAWGPGADGKGNFLYVADAGDYAKDRTDTCVYRIPEPLLSAESRIGTKARPRLTEGETARLLFQYPDGFHDSEALLVHPRTGAIYLVTKEEAGEAGVYKFPVIKPDASPLTHHVLTKIGSLTFGESGLHPFPNRVTGGDIAPDGKRLVLRTYFAAYEWRLPDGEKNFDAVWATTPAMIPLPLQPQGEGICYTANGASLIVSSERVPTAIYELKAR